MFERFGAEFHERLLERIFGGRAFGRHDVFGNSRGLMDKINREQAALLGELRQNSFAGWNGIVSEAGGGGDHEQFFGLGQRRGTPGRESAPAGNRQGETDRYEYVFHLSIYGLNGCLGQRQ